MGKIVGMVLVGLLVAGVSGSVAKSQDTSEKSGPVVTGTSPRAGDRAVDPSVKEIAVTFSKEMQTNNMWSWVMESADTFPTVTGKPHYLSDKRTCVLPVRLAPGNTYRIWINSDKFDAFRDPDNIPAVPYLLEFRTRQLGTN